MTSFFGALLLVAGVIALIKVSGLFPRALQAVRTSRGAFDVISDPELPDERKESLLQEYSLSLLRSFLDLLIRGAGSIAIPVATVVGFGIRRGLVAQGGIGSHAFLAVSAR